MCRRWAADIAALTNSSLTHAQALNDVHLTSDGPVSRHVSRGIDELSRKAVKGTEDREATAGCRNPAALAEIWPELWDVMASVLKILSDARSFSSDLRGLRGCCGSNPERAPPSDATLRAVRRGLERCFVLEPGTFEKQHEASPWRTELVATILYRAADPDAAIWAWLREGAPMGLSQTIIPGTHFPRTEVDATSTLEELDKREPWLHNHPSFDELHGCERSPAWDLLEEQVNHGFTMLFKSMEAAAAYLGGPCHPAPLGNVTRTKDDGTIKHRLIQDLRANGVNAAVALPERQVLPRGIDHGRDLAYLAQDLPPDADVHTLVLDFSNAFMSVPLHPSERRFNCAHTGFSLKRTRDAVIDGEVEEGRFVVWRCLGFGGRPNPLIFSRLASFAARTTQALMGEPSSTDIPAAGEGRLQLYVDDPTVAVRGTREQADAVFDIVILWWMVLGIPLAWLKGSFTSGSEPHRWIGILYHVSAEGAVMRLPPDFVADMLQRLEKACRRTGFISTSELEVLNGKAARVAHVVPAAKPFVAGLWGGLSATRQAEKEGVPWSRPGTVPCRRICYSASWLRALLTESEECPLRLERLVRPVPPPSSVVAGTWVVEFDASVYGGGAVLRNPDSVVVEYFVVVWDGYEAPHLNVEPGLPAHQTFWEFSTLVLSLCVWGDRFVDEVLSILGDNTGALNNALALKGKGNLLALARELSWRQARRRWRFQVGHLPSELNVTSDALSRVADPKGVPWPSRALASAVQVTPPKLQDMWRACPE